MGKVTASGKLSLPGSRIIVELGCTEAWGQHAINKFPCITATRGSQCNYWVADLGRQVTLHELMLLQGFNPDAINYKEAGVGRSQVGRMVGNAMSLNVMERLLASALRAVGLPAPVADKWAFLAQGYIAHA